MLGRAGAMRGLALFALVCLIIAAALLLPLLPSEQDAPAWAGAGGVWTTSDAMNPACQGCAPVAAHDGSCGTACPCQQPAPATVTFPSCLSLTIYLVVEPPPDGRSGEPQPLPPKLPTI